MPLSHFKNLTRKTDLIKVAYFPIPLTNLTPILWDNFSTGYN